MAFGAARLTSNACGLSAISAAVMADLVLRIGDGESVLSCESRIFGTAGLTKERACD